jgi:hypothetical protein
VSKTLTAIKNIAGVAQELTHNNTKAGRIALPTMVPGGKAADYKPMYDLERIFLYMMATEICNQAFTIGNAHGVNFRQIGPNGRPLPAAAGPPKPPASPAPQTEPAARGGAAATTGQWDEESVKALTVSLSGLQDLAQSALKAKVKSALEDKIQAVELNPGHFFWDANDNSGEHEMTEREQLLGGLSGAWGRLWATVVVEHVVGGAPGGMPEDVSHFGLVPDHERLTPQWVIGGAIDWKTKNDLDIEVTFTNQPHMHKPVGAYLVHSLWKWDESTSIMDCAITPDGLLFTKLAAVKLSGDKPDDGWF